MNDAMKWKVPKWPFWVINLLLIGFAYFFVVRAPLNIGHWAFAAVCVSCVVVGAIIGFIPYYLDYKAMSKVIEVNALGAVADKIENLEQFTARISATTDQWALIQDSVGKNAEKTAVAAKQIADKIGTECRDFMDTMTKMNDSEKASLRLEVDKLRRGETEYLQMLVRILDHIFSLQAAAVRSGQPKVSDQITQFQNGCLGMVRRVGLTSFVGEPEGHFDPDRHQVADGKKPFDGAVIAETVAAGYTFQGKMLRPALVRLREAKPAPPVSTVPEKPIVLEHTAQDDLALEAD